MENKIRQIDNMKQGLLNLISEIEQAPDKQNRLGEVEVHIFSSLMIIGKQLIQYYIGLVKLKTKKTSRDGHLEGCQNKGLFKRSYFSIFGQISFIRPKYYFPGGKHVLFPLDRALGIPKGIYSYVLQDWIGYSATDTDYRSSVSLLNRILGHDISGMQSERIANTLSGSVGAFYEEGVTGEKEECEFFAGGFDDKGIPIKASEVNRKVDSNGARLGKGQKRGVKKSSTVSVTYSFKRFVRKPEDIISSLYKEGTSGGNSAGPAEPRQWAKNKHVRAFLTDKAKAIGYGFENILQRCGETKKGIVVLIDGDRGLEKAIDRVMANKKIEDRIAAKILDFIHVTEYVWKAANARYGEKSTKRLDWVKEQCLLLLKSQLGTVVENLQGSIEKTKGKPTKQEAIQKVINYFLNHEHMMNYQLYLDRGFPISTGAVESACGHFVQNRMERNGMHWSLKGAQNILDLRAANKNNDWDNYLKYHINKEQEKYSCEYKMAA